MPAGTVRIGLTGGIGTGKSFVLDYLASRGVATLDTDAVARAVVLRGTPAFDAILERFGGGVIGPDGELDRAALARLVFADRDARRDLEAIVHPEVWRAVDAWQRGVRGPGVVAVPLLFETGAETRFDRTLVTECPEAMQVARVMARDGASEAGVRGRIASQMAAAERRRRADAIIDTSGSPAETRAQVDRVWATWGLPALGPGGA